MEAAVCGTGIGTGAEFKQLQDERTKLKRLVADLSLDNVMRQDVLANKFSGPRGSGVCLSSKFWCNAGILVNPGTKELPMGQYRRLTLMEREELSRVLAAGYSLRAAAQAMKRAPHHRWKLSLAMAQN